MRLRTLLLAVAVLVGACSGETADPIETIPPGVGAATAVDAVNELVTAINVPDFADASRLAMPGHAALAALAEGATFDEVADALRDGDEEIAANFWAGFAQGTGSFLTDGISTTDEGVVTRDDIEFHHLRVTPAGEGDRSVLVQDSDGYRIDLFGSFGSGLVDKMVGPVERLLTAQTDDSRLILAELRGIVPSLLVAAELPGTSTEVSQRMLALVEVITRSG